MVPLNYVLAAAMITSPPLGDYYTLAPPMPQFSTLVPTLRSVALSWELIDKRESCLFGLADDICVDIRITQGRWEELHDAPPLGDCMLFPERWLLQEQLNQNYAYKMQLESRWSFEPINRSQLAAAIQKIDEHRTVLDLTRDCRCELYRIDYRRSLLKKLKARLGAADYYSGKLPADVPVLEVPNTDAHTHPSLYEPGT